MQEALLFRLQHSEAGSDLTAVVLQEHVGFCQCLLHFLEVGTDAGHCFCVCLCSGRACALHNDMLEL